MTAKHIQSLCPSSFCHPERNPLQVNSSPAESIFHDHKNSNRKTKNLSVSSALNSFPLYRNPELARTELVHTKNTMNEAKETALPKSILHLCKEQREIPARKIIHKVSLLLQVEGVKAMVEHEVWIKVGQQWTGRPGWGGQNEDIPQRGSCGSTSTQALPTSHTQVLDIISPPMQFLSLKCPIIHSGCYICNKHLKSALREDTPSVQGHVTTPTSPILKQCPWIAWHPLYIRPSG